MRVPHFKMERVLDAKWTFFLLALKISQCSIQFLTHHLIALTILEFGSWITGHRRLSLQKQGRGRVTDEFLDLASQPT